MSHMINRLYWVVTAVLFALGIAIVLLWTPTEVTMGPVQKIFYIHLPAAICTFLACLMTFIASIGYLLRRRRHWDDLASASASVAVLLASVVLVTGILWGKSAWGQWWTWSPRLTFSLILWLLYVVYMLIRPSIAGSQRRAVVSAVYGIIAFLDVPLVYLSVRLMPDIHPRSIQLAPAMHWTLLYWFIPVIMLSAGLIHAGYRIQRRASLRGDQRQSDFFPTGTAPAGATGAP